MRTISAIAFLPLLAVFSGCGDSGDTDADTRPSGPAPRFALVDVTRASGIDFETRSGSARQQFIVEVKSTGVGLIDFDSDGRLDVVLTSGSTLQRYRDGAPGFGTRLYRNLGGMRFVDVTEASGIPATGWACAPVCADYDGDGRTDILITQIGKNMLLRNIGGRFEDVTEKAGVAGGPTDWSTSAAFADLDGDGDLDLYVCNYLEFPMNDPPRHGQKGWHCRWKDFDVVCGPKGFTAQRDICYRNDDGVFTDVTEDWGFADGKPSFGLGVLAVDLEFDGRTEVYVANDSMLNQLFVRDENGRFVEDAYLHGVALGEGGSAQAGMGVDAADINADGRQDIVCTNFSGEVNDLYLSVDEVWIESSSSTGVALDSRNELGWGCAIRDFDLDGRLDLFVANGHVYPRASRPGTNTSYPQASGLWMGGENAFFERVSSREMTGLAIKAVSRAAAFGDLDNDGDTDIVVANLNGLPTVIETRNDLAVDGRRWMGITLMGPAANRDGIGAIVRLLGPGTRLEVRRNASFQASNDPRVVFGLNDATIDGVEVTWPGGVVERFSTPPLGTYTTLEHGKGTR